jgi:hypothetical protein
MSLPRSVRKPVSEGSRRRLGIGGSSKQCDEFEALVTKIGSWLRLSGGTIRALAVVTTADDLFLAQLASPAVAWPDGP